MTGAILNAGRPEDVMVLGSFWGKLTWGPLEKRLQQSSSLVIFKVIRKGDLNTAMRLRPHEGKINLVFHVLWSKKR